ncbi:hypothetical protein QTP86_030511 [Hemibagrus guttatus]|nr:hypothetical protein QTP86_030511 [Hemibagrus guttatus]
MRMQHCRRAFQHHQHCCGDRILFFLKRLSVIPWALEAHFSISFYSSQVGQKHECPSSSLKHVQATATRTGPKHTQDYGISEAVRIPIPVV